MQQSVIFSSLEDRDQQALAVLLKECRFPAGDYIFWEGDHALRLHIVAEGTVKVVKHSSQGKEFIIGFFGPGEMFGEVAVFQDQAYPASAVAASDAAVLVLARDEILQFLAERPAVSLSIINMLGQRLRDAQIRLRDMAGERVEQRLARVLYMLYSKIGPALPFTRQEIADMAGITTETAIRFTGRLKDNGIVRPSRGMLEIVDPDRLREISEGHTPSS